LCGVFQSVAYTVITQIDGRISGIVQFKPVGVFTIFIGDGAQIGNLHFIDHKLAAQGRC
jgi:hypothetical protein